MTDESKLEDLSRRVADGESVDWDAEERRSTDPDYLQAIRNLKRLARVAGLQPGGPAGGFTDRDTAAYEDEPLPEERIGPYRLLQKVGEGGMGEVWEAEQEKPVCRRVALKLIKWGMDTRQVVARFESERQALALMDHPGIAKVFDAGATETGRPYFVMEYVKGVPINRYCDAHRLTTEERLELFMRVCEGVQHAHQKAIIHRDLKPSNVLVTEQDGKRQPKIIDFGVAKATAQKLTEKTLFTELGVLIGTPEYMSPEQAELTGEDVDTRTDVYSLGVILYELLVGALPFDPKELRSSGLEGIRKKIREEEPHRPSTRLSTLGDAATDSARARRVDQPTLRRELRGDLDWITMRALEKDRPRRYGSPMELAADIGRHLAHEPVQASPPSTAYRAGKFVRRHRFGVLAAAVGVVALIGFAATMAAQARRIALERDRAERANVDLESVVEFQAGMLSEMDTEGIGVRLMEDLKGRVEETSRRRGLSEAEAVVRSFEEAVRGVNATDVALRLIDEEILARAVGTLEEKFSEQPLIEARLRSTIGVTYRELGLYQAAEPEIERAVETQKRVLGDDHPDTLRSMYNLGVVHYTQGRYDEAETIYIETLEAQERVLGDDHPDTLWTMNSLGWMYLVQGRFDEAEALTLEALETRRRVLGDDHPDTLWSMNGLAEVYRAQGRVDEAEGLNLETFETRKRVLGDDHPRTLASMGNLSLLYGTQGRYDEAEALRIETIEAEKRVFGANHPKTLNSMNSLGVLYLGQGRYDEAEAIHLETLETRRLALGDDHPATLQSMVNLARAYSGQGRYDEAEPLVLKTLETNKRVLGDDHPSTLFSRHTLANVYSAQGRYDEAEALYIETIATGARVLPADHVQTRISAFGLSHLCQTLIRLGREEEALVSLDKAIENFPQVGAFYNVLTFVHFWLGQVEESIQATNKAIELQPRSPWAYLYRAGSSCHGSPDCDQVLADLHKALELAPGDSRIAASVAIRHVAGLYLPCPDEYDPRSALKLARGAVEANSENAFFQLTLGIALYRNGRFAESRDALLKALDLSTDAFKQELEPTNLFTLAMAQWNLGDKDEARSTFDRGVESMEETLPKSPLHNRFKAEAAQLLGIEP